jgi:hypothetical protein
MVQRKKEKHYSMGQHCSTKDSSVEDNLLAEQHHNNAAAKAQQ